MTQNEFVKTQGVEYLEFAVRDLQTTSELYEKMGFVCIGHRNTNSSKSRLYIQGDIRFILTASSLESDPLFQFTRTHGDGVFDIGFRVENAEDAFHLATRLGARPSRKLEIVSSHQGNTAHRAALHMFGDVRHTLISFAGTTRLEDFFPERKIDVSRLKGKPCQTIDHVSVNVEKGQVDSWAKFYHDVFGFAEIRHFDIQTARSGMLSRAIRSPNGRTTFLFNEPTDSKSQIQEFLNVFKGPGIQLVALHVSNIALTVQDLNSQGFNFFNVPSTYYSEIPNRVPRILETIEDLKKLNILVDGSEKGYLLQIFSRALVGPLFFEFIQRRGSDGFGEGNFQSLFNAMERDQELKSLL